MPNKTLLAGLVVAAALAAPAVASADSIVYLDQSAVWVAKPDGTQKQQLTPVSSYHSVAQADDGTIVAARTGGFDVLSRTGAVVRTVDTAPTRAANGAWHKGTPTNLSISPDGRLVAYEYRDLACAPENPGHCLLESTVMYTTTDGPTATPVETYGKQYNRESPSFLTNDRALIMGGAGAWASLATLGGGDSSAERWITDTADISEGELSRDGTRFAAVFGSGEDRFLGLLTVHGDPRTGVPARPSGDDVVCTGDGHEKVANPTWAPDGMGIALETKDGVEVTRLSAFAPGSCAVASTVVLSPTASEPDWGPADPAAPTTPGTTPGERLPVAPEPGKRPAQPKATAPAIGKVAPTRRALRKGLEVKVTVAAPGKITARLQSGRKTVASGSKRAAAGAVTVKLSKVGARAAKRLRGKTLKLVVTSPAGTTTRSLKVR